MGLRVTLMGTGGSTGVPHIGGPDGAGDWGACDPNDARNRRLRSSTLFENTDSGEVLLIDTSPDLRAQLIANRVRKADALLYTHAHADHVLGIDDVRQLNRIIERPLTAYGTKVTMDELIARFAYAFRPWKPPLFFSPVSVRAAGGDVRPGPRLHPLARPAGGPVRLFDRCGGFGRRGVCGVGWDRHLGCGLFPAQSAQDACVDGACAGLGGPAEATADDFDAYGHRDGLREPAPQPAARRGAGV